MCWIKYIIEVNGKKYFYEYKPVFISKKQCKDCLLNNRSFLTLKKQESYTGLFETLLNFTKSEYKRLENCIYNWHLHFSHPIYLVNITTNRWRYQTHVYFDK